MKACDFAESCDELMVAAPDSMFLNDDEIALECFGEAEGDSASFGVFGNNFFNFAHSENSQNAGGNDGEESVNEQMAVNSEFSHEERHDHETSSGETFEAKIAHRESSTHVAGTLISAGVLTHVGNHDISSNESEKDGKKLLEKSSSSGQGTRVPSAETAGLQYEALAVTSSNAERPSSNEQKALASDVSPTNADAAHFDADSATAFSNVTSPKNNNQPHRMSIDVSVDIGNGVKHFVTDVNLDTVIHSDIESRHADILSQTQSKIGSKSTSHANSKVNSKTIPAKINTDLADSFGVKHVVSSPDSFSSNAHYNESAAENLFQSMSSQSMAHALADDVVVKSTDLHAVNAVPAVGATSAAVPKKKKKGAIQLIGITNAERDKEIQEQAYEKRVSDSNGELMAQINRRLSDPKTGDSHANEMFAQLVAKDVTASLTGVSPFSFPHHMDFSDEAHQRHIDYHEEKKRKSQENTANDDDEGEKRAADANNLLLLNQDGSNTDSGDPNASSMVDNQAEIQKMLLGIVDEKMEDTDVSFEDPAAAAQSAAHEASIYAKAAHHEAEKSHKIFLGIDPDKRTASKEVPLSARTDDIPVDPPEIIVITPRTPAGTAPVTPRTPPGQPPGGGAFFLGNISQYINYAYLRPSSSEGGNTARTYNSMNSARSDRKKTPRQLEEAVKNAETHPALKPSKITAMNLFHLGTAFDKFASENDLESARRQWSARRWEEKECPGKTLKNSRAAKAALIAQDDSKAARDLRLKVELAQIQIPMKNKKKTEVELMREAAPVHRWGSLGSSQMLATLGRRMKECEQFQFGIAELLFARDENVKLKLAGKNVNYDKLCRAIAYECEHFAALVHFDGKRTKMEKPGTLIHWKKYAPDDSGRVIQEAFKFSQFNEDAPKRPNVRWVLGFLVIPGAGEKDAGQKIILDNRKNKNVNVRITNLTQVHLTRFFYDPTRF